MTDRIAKTKPFLPPGERRDHRVTSPMNDAELARLDRLRGLMSRAAFLRRLLEQADPLAG